MIEWPQCSAEKGVFTLTEPRFPLHHALRFAPMQPRHLAAVDAIERASFPTPRTTPLYRSELTENGLGHYFVLEPSTPSNGGQSRPLPPVLAYGGYWLIGAEAHVVVIATEPAWRRHGLGQWLLLEMMAVARIQGALQMALEVRQWNQPAQQLYLALGFVEVGVQRRYYRDTGEDAHLLTCFGLDDGAVWRPLAARLTAHRTSFAADFEAGDD